MGKQLRKLLALCLVLCLCLGPGALYARGK